MKHADRFSGSTRTSRMRPPKTTTPTTSVASVKRVALVALTSLSSVVLVAVLVLRVSVPRVLRARKMDRYAASLEIG